MKLETVVRTKGQTTIPDALRKKLGIGVGTIIIWCVQDGKLVGIRKDPKENAMQQHIRLYSGSCPGLSKVLKMTRP
jgi:bifunctional DNA-binding transcriptional regulator/antitoxin component of YhaV-PrlF toxin-antitoxin module